MRVKLTRNYRCAPEGHTTYKFKAGDEVEGVIAEMAIRDKAARKPQQRKTPPKPVEVKPAAPEEPAQGDIEE